MSRYSDRHHATGVQASASEDPPGERDPVRSANPLRITKLRLVLNGEVIHDYGGGGE